MENRQAFHEPFRWSEWEHLRRLQEREDQSTGLVMIRAFRGFFRLGLAAGFKTM